MKASEPLTWCRECELGCSVNPVCSALEGLCGFRSLSAPRSCAAVGTAAEKWLAAPPHEGEVLATPGCVSTAGTTISGEIHQQSTHPPRVSPRSCLCSLVGRSHEPVLRFITLMPSHLSSWFPLRPSLLFSSDSSS